MSHFLLSIVTPAFNNADSLPVLYERLLPVLEEMKIPWEWVIVDDHSTDNTPSAIDGLCGRDKRVWGLRLSRNNGSHLCGLCGLLQARGDCAVFLAADLQDPPEKIPELVEKWREGADVVWAERQKRKGESAGTLLFSRTFYYLMKRVVGLSLFHDTGADFFLLGRVVLDALRRFPERNSNVLAQVAWMGFRQKSIFYDKQAREYGRSGWSFLKKLKFAIDSMTAFTYFPIRAITATGFGFAIAGLALGSWFAYCRLQDIWIGGSAGVLAGILFVGGANLLALGTTGEYVWRALEEARRRPRYLIEQRFGTPDDEFSTRNAPSYSDGGIPR